MAFVTSAAKCATESATSNTTVLTAGATSTLTLIGVNLSNALSVAVEASVYVSDGGTEYYIVKDAPIPVGGALSPIGGDQKIVLEANQTLKASYTTTTTGTTNGVHVVASYLEQ